MASNAGDVAAQHGRQVLMHDEARPDEAAEWPSTMENSQTILGARRLIGEDDMELGEIDLCLLAGRCLEANLEALRFRRPNVAQEIGQRRVAAAIAEILDLTEKPPPRQAGIGLHTIAQIGREGIDHRRPWLARPVDRSLQSALDIFAHRLAIGTCLPGDRRHRQTLPM